MQAIVLLSALAFATDPVVHGEGDAGAALQAVSTAMNVPADSLASEPLETLLTKTPLFLEGGGSITQCTASPVSNRTIEQKVEEAAGALVYQEFERGHQLLDEASDDLACLDELLQFDLLPQLHLLRGGLYFLDGHESDASTSFERALTLNGNLSWDEALPKKAKPIFEAAKGKMEEVELVVWPTDAYLLDGRLRVSRTTPGQHVLQHPHGQTWVLDVPDGPKATLVIPSLFTDKKTLEPTDMGTTSFLAATVGEGRLAYMVHKRTIWRGTTGRTDWEKERLRLPVLNLLGRHALAYGSVAALSGGVATAVLYGQTKSFADLASSTTTATHDDTEAEWATKAKQFKTVRWVPIGGTAVALVGGILMLQSPIKVAPLTQGRGIAVTVRTR
ncbi:MAG: hypothetical protein HN348_03135 [Proteobacteria bacterium]|nr:hypothetical protein [Pseudomonadota bacterium]